MIVGNSKQNYTEFESRPQPQVKKKKNYLKVCKIRCTY